MYYFLTLCIFFLISKYKFQWFYRTNKLFFSRIVLDLVKDGHHQNLTIIIIVYLMSKIRVRALLNTIKNATSSQVSNQQINKSYASFGRISTLKKFSHASIQAGDDSEFNCFTLPYDEFTYSQSPEAHKQQPSLKKLRLSKSAESSYNKQTITAIKNNQVNQKKIKLKQQNLQELGICQKLVNNKMIKNKKSSIIVTTTINSESEKSKKKVRKPLHEPKHTASQPLRQKNSKLSCILNSQKQKKKEWSIIVFKDQKQRSTSSEQRQLKRRLGKGYRPLRKQDFQICPWNNMTEVQQYDCLC